MHELLGSSLWLICKPDIYLVLVSIKNTRNCKEKYSVHFIMSSQPPTVISPNKMSFGLFVYSPNIFFPLDNRQISSKDPQTADPCSVNAVFWNYWEVKWRQAFLHTPCITHSPPMVFVEGRCKVTLSELKNYTLGKFSLQGT